MFTLTFFELHFIFITAVIKAVGMVEEPLPLALRRVLGSLLTTVKHKSPVVATADHEEEPPQGKTYIYIRFLHTYVHTNIYTHFPKTKHYPIWTVVLWLLVTCWTATACARSNGTRPKSSPCQVQTLWYLYIYSCAEK